MKGSETITLKQAKALWISSQGLHKKDFFGKGPAATLKAIEQLGYVQIDTINVIERCHHHILYSRISDYKRKHLHQAQSIDKNIFEYWTHALAYVPVKDFSFYQNRMKQHQLSSSSWFGSVTPEDTKKIFKILKDSGAISIRDIKDDVLVEKSHAWGSKKPSKKALSLAFNQGKVTISERLGMLKKYELTERHFNWDQLPKAASEKEICNYKLERALKSQGLFNLESATYLEKAEQKLQMKKAIEARVQSGTLIPIEVTDIEKTIFYTSPENLNLKTKINDERTHILSPFDPLVIQRKRLKMFFDYEHLFEAYIPKEKRVYGYFTLPVLIGDQIVAMLDLKTDRENNQLLIQKWTWRPKLKSATFKKLIETELDRFEKFQLSTD